MAEPTFLEQYIAKLNRRGNEISEFFNRFSNTNTTQQPANVKAPTTNLELVNQLRKPRNPNQELPPQLTRDPITGQIRRPGTDKLKQGLFGREGVLREALDQGAKKLGGQPFTQEQIALGRARVGDNVGMGEFANASGPMPFPLGYDEVNVNTLPAPQGPPASGAGSALFPFTQPGIEPDELLDNLAIAQMSKPTGDVATDIKNKLVTDTAKAYTFGAKTAQSQKQEGLINEASDTISGLLGNVDFKGLFRVLARPEFVAPMGPGQTPLTNFINAAAADRTAQAATRAAQQEAGLEGFKAETDRLKALMPDPSKMPKLTSEVNKMYDQLSSAQSMAEIGDKIRVSLDKSFAVTGGPGVAAEGLRAIAAMFGADIEVEADKVNLRTAELKRMILEGKIFGREANKQELEILSKLVQGPGFTTNKSQILNALDSLTKQAEKRSFNVTNRLKAFGMPTDFTNKRPSNTGFIRN